MIGVWLAPVAGLDPDDVALLDADERARLEGLAHPADRAAFAAGHALARRALGERLDVAASTITFDRGCAACGGSDHGKPVLAGPPDVAFSASRSRGLVGVAVGGSSPVGFDLESLDGVPAGASSLVGLPDDAQPAAVARQWVRTEAALKASGQGLSVAPEAVRLTGPDAAPRLLAWPLPDAPSVHLADLDLPAGFAGALAVIGGGTPAFQLHHTKETQR